MKNRLPLNGLKVIEFSHAVMGPVCGLLLASHGADVTLIEPPEGSSTRRLKGFGSSYFPFFNRNKKSITLDLKSDQGRQIALKLVKNADIVIENFAPNTMKRLQMDYETLSLINPKLIYCSMKGFMNGKYENRHAMDEVVQMMGGLAYMTGLPNQPLRVGTSVIDISGGMFGYIGILQALLERTQTQKGKLVKSTLFETVTFLMGQHLAYAAIEQKKITPMSVRTPAWSVYRYFETKDDEKIFIGIISEKHWKRFCHEFQREDLMGNPELKTNDLRIKNRGSLIPELEKMMLEFTANQIHEKVLRANIPFAPVNRPEDLIQDEHLNQNGFLEEMPIIDGIIGKLPKIPLEYDGELHEVGLPAPQKGQHTDLILKELGYTDQQIAHWRVQKII